MNTKEAPPYKLLHCPYCPIKPATSHRTACYRVVKTSQSNLIFRCIACRRTFMVNIQGGLILQETHMKSIAEENKNEKRIEN